MKRTIENTVKVKDHFNGKLKTIDLVHVNDPDCTWFNSTIYYEVEVTEKKKSVYCSAQQNRKAASDHIKMLIEMYLLIG